MTHPAELNAYRSLADKHLGSLIGERTDAFGALWCERAKRLVTKFDDVDICTLRALRECLKVYHVEMSVLHQQLLMVDFGNLSETKSKLCGEQAGRLRYERSKRMYRRRPACTAAKPITARAEVQLEIGES